VFSLYEVFVNITTVGYGDYTAGTLLEYLFTIWLEIIGLLVFSSLMYAISIVEYKDFDFE